MSQRAATQPTVIRMNDFYQWTRISLTCEQCPVYEKAGRRGCPVLLPASLVQKARSRRPSLGFLHVGVLLTGKQALGKGCLLLPLPRACNCAAGIVVNQVPAYQALH